MKAHGRGEPLLYILLMLALSTVKLLYPCGKNSLYTLNRRQGGSPIDMCTTEVKNVLALPGIKPLFLTHQSIQQSLHWLSNIHTICTKTSSFNITLSFKSIYTILNLPIATYVGGADKVCLHCNISICIRHIWIKPVLCSHMVSLFHHFTLKTQMLTVLTQRTSKWKSFSDVQFKQRAVIEFLTAEKFLQLKFTDECKAFMVISVLMWVQ